MSRAKDYWLSARTENSNENPGRRGRLGPVCSCCHGDRYLTIPRPARTKTVTLLHGVRRELPVYSSPTQRVQCKACMGTGHEPSRRRVIRATDVQIRIGGEALEMWGGFDPGEEVRPAGAVGRLGASLGAAGRTAGGLAEVVREMAKSYWESVELDAKAQWMGLRRASGETDGELRERLRRYLAGIDTQTGRVVLRDEQGGHHLDAASYAMGGRRTGEVWPPDDECDSSDCEPAQEGHCTGDGPPHDCPVSEARELEPRGQVFADEPDGGRDLSERWEAEGDGFIIPGAAAVEKRLDGPLFGWATNSVVEDRATMSHVGSRETITEAMDAAEATLRPADDNPDTLTEARREVARLLVVRPELKQQGWRVWWGMAKAIAEIVVNAGTGVTLYPGRAAVYFESRKVAEVLPREGESIADLMRGAADTLERHYGVRLGSSPNSASDRGGGSDTAGRSPGAPAGDAQ